MTIFNPVIDLQLPWASSSKEDKSFKIILFVFLFFLSSLGIWMHGVVLPKADRKELEKLPASVAKVVIKKKEELKRVPLPVAKPEVKTVDEKKPEEKKPEEKKTEVVKKVKPVLTPKQVHEAKVTEAKAVANKEISKIKDDLAAMRNMFAAKSIAPGGGNSGIKVSTALGNKGAGVSRTQIVGTATGGSGGISVASGASSGLGGGSGGGVGSGSGSGRGDTNVDSVTLGGAIVDQGGDVAKAIENSKSGNRSEEAIRAVLDQNKAALYAIYNRALRENPSLQGKVTFKLVIEPNGSVSSCSIVSSGLDDAALGNKLISRMKFIDFGAAAVSVTTTQWAIDFLPY